MKLFSQQQIQSRVVEIGKALNDKYKNHPSAITIVVILDGGFMFAADLIRELEFDFQLQFIKVSSYRDNEKTDQLHWKLKPSSMAFKDIILIDDIADTGDTLNKVCKELHDRGANSISTVVLLKKAKRLVSYYGFEIEDRHFVYGYGLDLDNGYKRHLRDILISESTKKS